jgi:hypothetical protein
MATPSKDQAEVILVGCGAPLRGMGWYHAVQIIAGECPSAKLCHVVEPWFMGAGATGPGGAEFMEFKAKTEADHSVGFHSSLSDVPPPSDGARRLALISGRTADNPRLLSEAIAAGCSTVYLEKPGEFVGRDCDLVPAFLSVWVCVRGPRDLKYHPRGH